MEKLYSVGGQKAEENKKQWETLEFFHQPRKRLSDKKPRTNQKWFQMKATNIVKHSNIVDREKRSEALGTGKLFLTFLLC